MNTADITATSEAVISDRAMPPSLATLSPRAAEIVSRTGIFGLGEAYVNGEFECADVEAIMRGAIQSGLVKKLSLRRLRCLLTELLLNPQTGAGVFVVARRHYDLGDDLFATMLDDTMTYTCGDWRNASTLHEAQEAKLALACQKLGLKPGMKVLDIGCGWGNFAHYAASKYGVSVVGLTISENQAGFARARCKGLPVDIRIQDYRTISGEFDRVISIEMIEAVGRKNISAFFDVVHRSLAPGGLFLLQAICGDTFSTSSSASLDDYIVWILKHIFPNGYLPKMRELTAPATKGFIIEDTQLFPDDYAKTLRAWEDNFEAGWSGLSAKYGERFRRIWKFYLAGCRALFREREVLLYQMVYAKRGGPAVAVRAK